MLYEVMRYCRNFFPVPESALTGTFTISDGTICLPFLDGQYFLIEGSVLNDGVYQYDSCVLEDETFTGRITPLRVPKAFLSLVDEISDYQNKLAEKGDFGLYKSESFGGYSYTLNSGSSGYVDLGWQSHFSDKLNIWRKV